MTNQERAAEVIRRNNASLYPFITSQALADAGLLMPDEDERLPSWVYGHPDVCTNPHRMGGQPCVRGTRIPVGILLDWIADCPEDDIREFYPSITSDVFDRLTAAAKLAEEQE